MLNLRGAERRRKTNASAKSSRWRVSATSPTGCPVRACLRSCCELVSFTESGALDLGDTMRHKFMEYIIDGKYNFDKSFKAAVKTEKSRRQGAWLLSAQYLIFGFAVWRSHGAHSPILQPPRAGRMAHVACSKSYVGCTVRVLPRGRQQDSDCASDGGCCSCLSSVCSIPIR